MRKEISNYLGKPDEGLTARLKELVDKGELIPFEVQGKVIFYYDPRDQGFHETYLHLESYNRLKGHQLLAEVNGDEDGAAAFIEAQARLIGLYPGLLSLEKCFEKRQERLRL